MQLEAPSHLVMVVAPYSISLKPPGDCFAKCRDVPWFLMNRHTDQTNKWRMPQKSCNYAKAIGCTVPGGQQVGFIDYISNPQRWWACHCDSGEYNSWGECKRGFHVVKQESDSDNW